MDKDRSGTVNTGGAPEPTEDEQAAEYEIAGNVERHGEDPSPDDRERGETSRNERQTPVDINR